MSARQDFEMSPDDVRLIMDRIAKARSTPLIMLQCGMPQSAQEAANAAWAELGNRMGFDPMSVRPNGKGDRFFSAVPTVPAAKEPVQ